MWLPAWMLNMLSPLAMLAQRVLLKSKNPVNVAAGLEGQARPNRIFIGPATYTAVAGKFAIRPLGPLEIKKRTQAVEVYEVLRG